MLSDDQKADFANNGFVLVPGLMPLADVEVLRQRLDDCVYGRVPFPKGVTEYGRAIGVPARQRPAPTMGSAAGAPAPTVDPEIKLTDRHARRGDQVYPAWMRAIDEATKLAVQRDDDPYTYAGQINSITDHDGVFRRYAAHPNVVAVLNKLIGPDVKLFFDHVFNKAPYAGANRYHQDGFFMFSEETVTCWIALDPVTRENGSFHYLPKHLGYGRFNFDRVAAPISGSGITARELAYDVDLELNPGDALLHDRWTIHGTGPNHTPRHRRGWALHYTSARSKLVTDPTWLGGTPYTQTPDGLHWAGDHVYGNTHYLLVSGREYPGCV